VIHAAEVVEVGREVEAEEVDVAEDAEEASKAGPAGTKGLYHCDKRHMASW